MANETYLEISSWKGIGIGASHSYGSLWNNGKTVVLMRILTKKEANRLNGCDGCKVFGTYRKGMKTERFNTVSSIIRLAKRQYRTFFPDSTVLLRGKHYCPEEAKVILVANRI